MAEETKTQTKKKKRIFKVTRQGKQVPNCVHELVVARNNQLIYEKWLFRKTDFPCGGCGSIESVVFTRTSPLNLVIRSCENCGVTEAVYERNPDNGDALAYPLETKVITIDEAKVILLRNNCKKKFLSPELIRVLKTKPRKRLPIAKLEGVELE